MANLNLQDILNMFQNGERRYAEDPAFKAAVDSLKMGLGVYAVLDHVLKDQSTLRHNLKEATEHLRLANDEIESWKDANEGLRQNIDMLLNENRT